MRNTYLCKAFKPFLRRFATVAALLFLSVETAICAGNKFVLVIDAGHGGHDTGALGAYSREKDINLKVALAFGKYVESNCGDVKVIYTRKTDVFIPLQERANIANRNNADLFISVHTNALPAGRIARGFEAYTLGMHRAKDNLDVAMRENSVISMETDYEHKYQGFDPKSSESYIMFEFMQTANMEKSVELARMMQRSVCKTACRNNKGVHQAGFLVLRQTTMPGCLIELGFITTADEEDFLNTESGVDALACGVFNAFAEYKNKYNSKVVVPYLAPKSPAISVGRIAPRGADNLSETKGTKKTVAQKTTQKSQPVVQSQKKDAAVAQKKDSVVAQSKAGNKSQDKTSASKNADKPVFKVQIFVVNKVLSAGSSQLKGHSEAEYYKDGGNVKYTIGSSADYNEILALRRSLLSDFPQAFIVAFKNGVRMDVNAAIAEFRKNK